MWTGRNNHRKRGKLSAIWSKQSRWETDGNRREKDHDSGTQTSFVTRILEETRILCRMEGEPPETNRPKINWGSIWRLCEQGGHLAAPFPLPGRERGAGLAVPHIGAVVSVDQVECLGLDDRLG